MRTAEMPRLGDRRSGVLLHVTSLPGPHGCGDLGPAAWSFAEFLAAAGQSWWQMLPIGPPGYGNCPYMSTSVFAGNPHLISLETLHEAGLLDTGDLRADSLPKQGRVRFAEMAGFREPRLRKASGAFFKRARTDEQTRFEAFCRDHEPWLTDHALFCALKEETGGAPWTSWPSDLRARKPEALAGARERLARELQHHRFLQYEFARQWSALRDRCRVLGLGLIGDIPIFVAHESVDVWANPDLFHLDAEGHPTVVAGVPPDYFSTTGQRWGHPLYRWDRLRERGYGWWIARCRRTLGMFDVLRLDHFIGFINYWEIPASSPTAVEGRWMPGPGADFFHQLQNELGQAPIIAEDLGVVTEKVIALREQFGFPGMRVLQFAFGGDPRSNDHLPHRYPRQCVVYTGTHDNDTTPGWFQSLRERSVQVGETEIRREKDFLLGYLASDGREVHWDMIRLAWMSVADLAIAPMQDLLGLGSDARMNVPSEPLGNWEWRMSGGVLTEALAHRLLGLTETYVRAPVRASQGTSRGSK